MPKFEATYGINAQATDAHKNTKFNPNSDQSLISDGAQNEVPYSAKIGRGEEAKSSVVWFVITFTLTLYACITSAMIIVDIFDSGGKNILNNIKESWVVFSPIITLSLGYMFGKNSALENEQRRIEIDKDK